MKDCDCCKELRLKPDIGIRSFIHQRIIQLRFGCLRRNNQTKWPLSVIARALGIRTETVIRHINKWKRAGFKLIPDKRKNSPNRR